MFKDRNLVVFRLRVIRIMLPQHNLKRIIYILIDKNDELIHETSIY